jgi:hypothetical protein
MTRWQTNPTRGTPTMMLSARTVFLFSSIIIVSLFANFSHAAEKKRNPPDKPKPAPTTIPTEAPATPVGRFEAADALFKERVDQEKMAQMVAAFEKLYNETPEDSEAIWRYAMGLYYRGIRIEKDPDKKAEIYEKARDIAKAGTKANPNCAPCHFWAAVNGSLYANSVGALKVLVSLEGIQKHLKASVEADPTYASGGAYRTLGLIQQKLPGIFGGSNDRAREYYDKAMSVAPDEPLNYLFMVRLLQDEFEDEKEVAMNYAKKGVAIGELPKDRIEGNDARKELQHYVENGVLREGAGTPD